MTQAGRLAAESRQRTLRRSLCGRLGREKNSQQPNRTARGQAAAVGLTTASAHTVWNHILCDACHNIIQVSFNPTLRRCQEVTRCSCSQRCQHFSTCLMPRVLDPVSAFSCQA